MARHSYGQGTTLSAGFDLIGSLQMPASESVMRVFLIETLGALTPEAPETLVGNAYLPVVVDVTHSGKSATTADVSIALPTGVKFVDASPAPSAVTGDRVTWSLALASEDLQSLRLGIRVPVNNTALRLTANIAETLPEVSTDLDIAVTHFDAARMGGVVAQISDPVASEAAQAAQTAFAAADYTTAITELVKTDQALPTNAASALCLNLAHWLQEAELLWKENTSVPTIPTSIVAVSGTPQTAIVNTAFAQILRAKVLDSSSNPVPEARVTFNLPTSGASGTFVGSGTSVTATTDAQGEVVTPTVIANGTAGSYTVTATAQGVTQPASFALTNQSVAPIATSIAAVGGTPQSATVNTAFVQTLQAVVLDASNQPVQNATVTFALPVSGASAAFSGGGITATAMTNVQGIAVSPTLMANATAGNYQAQASVSGVTEKALFDLTNETAIQTPSTVNATGGTPQSATVNTVFVQALQATVRDTSDQPIAGVTVTFTLPVSGASAAFAGGGGITATVMTNEQGIAVSPTLMANATAGSYQAQASVVGVTEKAFFDLTNEAVTVIPVARSVTAESGTPQSAEIGTAFVVPLKALVKDTNGVPMVGVDVTFTLPASGASAAFAGGGITATAMTDAQGIAVSPTLMANATAGSYQAQASVVGVTERAFFDLTNTATPGGGEEPASIVALNDTTQVATVNTVFAYPLRVKVLNIDNQPVAGALVTFTLPVNGASAVFTNGQKSVAVVTDAQGVATSTILTANATAGYYSATAAVEGVATAATFELINSAIPGGTHSAATDLLVVGGNSQIAAVNTSFTQPLQVMALDAENRPVPDLEVTFTLPNSGASARFTGDVLSVAVKTDAQGVATSPTLIANAVAGSFTATVTAGALQAEFTLTNREAQMTPNRIVTAAGASQTAMVNTAFAETLKALVLDANQQPLSGIAVTFSLPTTGASATFPGGAATITAATDENGLAITPALIANGVTGSYYVVATVEGIAQSAVFALTNSAAPVVIGDTPVSIAAVGGTPQTVTVGAAFAQTLQAKVLDASSRPVANATVTFTLPATGASAAFIGVTGNTVTVATNAGGIAVSPALVADATAGSYTASARVDGVVTIAEFSLTNEAATVVSVAGSIAAVSGTPQSAEVNTAFALPLEALIKDTGNMPMSGVAVTFTLPASGASALFDNGRNTLTVLTDGNGVASSRTLIANSLEGSYSVTASVEDVATTARFDLTNEAATVIPVPTAINATGGTSQSTTVNTSFVQPLRATVLDASSQPVPNATVTFTLPASGASATFAGSGATATATTDAQGIATSPTLTANGTAGSYQAQASVAGVAGRAFFNLTNTAAPGNTAPTFSGATATGSGTVSANITGGGQGCVFDLDHTRTSMPSGAMMNLLGKYLMPHGVLEFVLVGCDVGSTVTVTTTWPSLRGVTGYMKYGPTPWLPWASTWYVPNHVRISGNSVSYTITDGGLGDDDLTKNGVIRDPGGPIVPLSNGAEAIPTLGRAGQALLLLLMMFAAGFGYHRVRRS
jgi:hypothetical protein